MEAMKIEQEEKEKAERERQLEVEREREQRLAEAVARRAAQDKKREEQIARMREDVSGCCWLC